jgi:hypothetical protein
MTVPEPNSTILTLPPYSFVQNSFTECHEKPTIGSVADARSQKEDIFFFTPN